MIYYIKTKGDFIIMKRFLAIILAAALTLAAYGCGKKDDKAAADKTPKPTKAAQTVKPDESAAPDTDTAADVREQGDGTMKRLEAPDEEPEVIKDKDERNFTGTWRAYSTTSENAAFESLNAEIHYDSYKVTISFKDDTPDAEFEGTYKIKNGVLIFDKNFQDCTAFFTDDKTLVLDNGTSYVYCERLLDYEVG